MNFELNNAKEFYKNVEELYDDFSMDETEMEVLANDHKSIVVYGYKLFGFNIVEHNYYSFTKGISVALRPNIYFNIESKDKFQEIVKKYNGKLETPPYAEDHILGFIFYDQYNLLNFFWNEIETLNYLTTS